MKEQKPQHITVPEKTVTSRTIEQMVDGIAGKPSASPQEQELRRRLAGRAAEALMFMDDEDE